MELNAEQIMEALECCASEKYICTQCPIDEKIKDDCECGKVVARNALALIKQLTQAHEMLSESYDHLEKTKDELLAERSRLTEANAIQTITAIELDKQVQRLTEENVRLSKEIADLKDELHCEKETNEHLCGEYMREKAENEWISVKDRLPDNYRAVLVSCEGTSISGGRLRAIGSYGGGCWSMADADGTHRLTKYMQYVVTHWMELPKSPKGE